MDRRDQIVHCLSTPAAKIELFRSLFRGRNDVYACRFENRKTGKSGYSPACGNEWIRGLCEKPRIKCTACPHQKFLTITDEVIRWHLSGQDDAGREFVVGVYPMLLDECCHFLAVDFDEAQWKEDARAFAQSCHELGVPVALEISRSGNGAHAWVFFARAVSARDARRTGIVAERSPPDATPAGGALIPTADPRFGE